MSGLGSEKGDSLRETIIIYSDAYRQLFQSGNRLRWIENCQRCTRSGAEYVGLCGTYGAHKVCAPSLRLALQAFRGGLGACLAHLPRCMHPQRLNISRLRT